MWQAVGDGAAHRVTSDSEGRTDIERPRIRLLTGRTPHDVAVLAADHIGHCVHHGARVLGVATGRTPLATYEELITRQRGGRASFVGCDLVLLDEYVGLESNDPRSFRKTIISMLAEPLGIHADHVHAPDGRSGDPDVEAARFERRIADLGGVQLQLLGIGRNGHIGFNEPGTPWTSRTHRVELADMTRLDNADSFGGDDLVPATAITQGIATIMSAQSILLLATGEAKSEAMERLLHDEPSPDLPASVLQGHPEVLVVSDQAALCRDPPGW